MSKKRGKRHTTLTETAKLVVRELEKIPGIKMIAPGEIDPKNSSRGGRFVTIVHTVSGCELLISGQGSQKVSVHTDKSETILPALQGAKSLRQFVFKERERYPEN